MKTSIKQIQDYCYCPLLYKFKHMDGVKVPLRLSEQFEADLHKVLYCFYHYLLDDKKIPTLKYLLGRWHSIWDGRKTRDEILYSSRSLSRNSEATHRRNYYLRGIRLLEEFYDFYALDPGTPILVAKDYEVDFGSHKLGGTIELVREKKSKLEIIDFKVNYDPLHVQKDMDLTASSFAFRVLMRAEEDRLTYHSIGGQSNVSTKRDIEDYKVLLTIISNIEKAILGNIFYPVMNTRCSSCACHGHCKTKGWFK